MPLFQSTLWPCGRVNDDGLGPEPFCALWPLPDPDLVCGVRDEAALGQVESHSLRRGGQAERRHGLGMHGENDKRTASVVKHYF